MLTRAPIKKSLLHFPLAAALLGVLLVAGPAAAAAIDPNDPNLQLWLKADAGVTTTGGTITSWTDSSSAGNNATAGGTPTLVMRTYNSQSFSAIDFNRNGDLFDVAGLSLGSGVESTYFVVFQTNYSGTNDRFIDAVSGSGGFRNYSKGVQGGSADVVSFYDGGGDGSVVLQGTVDINNIEFHIGALRVSSSAMSHFVDGAIDPLTPVGYTPSLTAVDDFTIGSDANPSHNQDYEGDIAEVLIYNAALSDAEVLAISFELGQKYGIAVDAPLVVVPEPSTLALLAISLALGALLTRGRRRT